MELPLRTSPGEGRGVVLLALAVFVVAGAGLAHVAVGFPDGWDPSRYQTLPDAAGDWLTTRASVDGVSPFLPVDELAARYDVPVDDLPPDAVHPRFPGALVLQLPLLMVSWSSVLSWMTAVNLLALALVGWWLWRWRGVTSVAIGLPFLVLTPLFLELVAHGGHVGPLVLMLTGAWWLASKQYEVAAGLLVGGLAVLRGFPLLLLPALWLSGRRAAAWWGAAAFLALNGAGMLAFDLGLAEVVSGMALGTGLFGPDVHNASVPGLLSRTGLSWELAVPIGMIAALGGWAWSVRRGRRSLDSMLGVTVPAMLLASPLSWPSYHLLYLPVFAWWVAANQVRTAKAAATIFGGAYAGWHVAGTWLSGPLSGISNVFMAGASARAAEAGEHAKTDRAASLGIDD